MGTCDGTTIHRHPFLFADWRQPLLSSSAAHHQTCHSAGGDEGGDCGRHRCHSPWAEAVPRCDGRCHGTASPGPGAARSRVRGVVALELPIHLPGTFTLLITMPRPVHAHAHTHAHAAFQDAIERGKTRPGQQHMFYFASVARSVETTNPGFWGRLHIDEHLSTQLASLIDGSELPASTLLYCRPRCVVPLPLIAGATQFAQAQSLTLPAHSPRVLVLLEEGELAARELGAMLSQSDARIYGGSLPAVRLT